MTLIGRIGRFLLFVGLIALGIFFATDQAYNPVLEFFCVGIILVILGILLMLRGRTPPEPSGRFRMLRKRRDKEGKDEG